MATVKIEACHEDLVVDEPAHGYASILTRLLEVFRLGEPVDEAVEFAQGIQHRGLILFGRGREENPVIGHLLHVGLSDAERDVALFDFLVFRVQAQKALVGVDGFLVGAARKLGVSRCQLGQGRILREGEFLLDVGEVARRLLVVLLLQLSQALLVVLLGGEREVYRLAFVAGCTSGKQQAGKQQDLAGYAGHGRSILRSQCVCVHGYSCWLPCSG